MQTLTLNQELPLAKDSLTVFRSMAINVQNRSKAANKFLLLNFERELLALNQLSLVTPNDRTTVAGQTPWRHKCY